MSNKKFCRLQKIGNGLGIYLDKESLKHLKVYKDSDICLTLNKRGSITISKAKYSDKLIEDIIANLEFLD